MPDLTRGGPMAPWQRQVLVTAVATLRQQFGTPPADPKMRAVHDAILEVLDPARRAARLQKEFAAAAQKAALTASSERRLRAERRAVADRRRQDLGPPGGIERRTRADRRTGRSRRAAA
jgi:hypothetical protein